uniref:Putative lyr motif-containing protein 5 n=1 Tax=Xenopsylla cheopis TaxID=163159 RepID=A0A6M2DSF1_XENCH
MSTPSPAQVLRLYKNLLRYGKNLQYTDKEYFCNRIRKEFRNNKTCTQPEELIFNFKVCISLLAKLTQFLRYATFAERKDSSGIWSRYMKVHNLKILYNVM